jgi:hypothetical protein
MSSEGALDKGALAGDNLSSAAGLARPIVIDAAGRESN